MEHNAALKLRNINPDLTQMEDGQGIEIVFKTTTFPRTQLPEFEFTNLMLACPALLGKKQKSKIVYLQLVLPIITKFNRFSNWVFALLESPKKQDRVYPLTLSQTNTANDHLKLENLSVDEIRNIHDDDEID